MQRIDLEKTNLTPNFVGSWIIQPATLCDSLIEYFESNPVKHQKGSTTEGVNLQKKNSFDISIAPKEINEVGNEVFKDYFNQLFDCYKDYVIQWPFLERIRKNLEIGRFNLQRYKSGEHFNQVHTERVSLESDHRVLTWMTYLNDVEDGGSTYFTHYDLEVSPRKGLTLIWPAEWTHAHKGNVLNSGSKYIITGWLYFSG